MNNNDNIKSIELTDKEKLIFALIQSMKTETQSMNPSIEGIRLIADIHDRLMQMSEEEKKNILN